MLKCRPPLPPRLKVAAVAGGGGGLVAPWWAATAGSAHRGAALLADHEICAASVANVSTALVAALALRPVKHLSISGVCAVL